MSKEEYISISEFAKRAGVSAQAVYKRLDKEFQPWLKVSDGKKVISIKALEVYKKEKLSTEVESFDELKRTISLLEKQLELMTTQNAALVDSLHSQVLQLQEKDTEIQRLHERLADITETLKGAQALHAATAQRLLLLEQPQQPAPAAEGQTSDVSGAPATSPETVAAAPIRTEQPKASLWERIKAARIR